MMPALFRRVPLAPDDVVARAGLARGDKVLAAARSTDGTWLVATRSALVLVTGDDAVHLPWQHIGSADWNRDDERLRVAEVGEFGRVRWVHSHVLEDATQLLAVVRERVTASIVLQRRVVVRGKQGLVVVARRAPNTNDDLTWSYELDAGLDPDDPEVRALAERGLRGAAEELGLA